MEADKRMNSREMPRARERPLPSVTHITLPSQVILANIYEDEGHSSKIYASCRLRGADNGYVTR